MPTCSWAAVSGAVLFPRRPFDLGMFESRVSSTFGDEIVIIDAKVEVSGNNPFGRVQSGYITLQGHLFKSPTRTADSRLITGPRPRSIGHVQCLEFFFLASTIQQKLYNTTDFYFQQAEFNLIVRYTNFIYKTNLYNFYKKFEINLL